MLRAVQVVDTLYCTLDTISTANSPLEVYSRWQTLMGATKALVHAWLFGYDELAVSAKSCLSRWVFEWLVNARICSFNACISGCLYGALQPFA